MKSNRRKLTIVGLFALAISGIAPTGSLAYGTVATAKFAGYNIPIAFLLGGLGILCVAGCFASMAKYISDAGSSYAYNREAIGEKAGFITGWIWCLSYLAITPAHSGLVSNFFNVFMRHFGMHFSLSVTPFVMIFIVWLISILGINFTSKIALVTESVSLVILLFLSIVILYKAGVTGNLTAKPFVPHHNWSGIGQGMIFVVLSYSGFEEISTVSESSKHPKKTVPRALIWSVLLAAVFFIMVSYVQITGFGIKNMGTFMKSPSPLDALSVKFLGTPMAVIMDLAIFLSAFASFLGCSNGCVYMLYALSKNHYLPHYLSKFTSTMKSPRNSVTTTGIVTALAYALVGVPFGFQYIYTNAATLGTLGTVISYMLVCAGSGIFYWRKHRNDFSIFRNIVVPVIGIGILMFPLISNIYPVPKFPANLFPYFLVLWVLLGLVIYHYRKRDLKKDAKK